MPVVNQFQQNEVLPVQALKNWRFVATALKSGAVSVPDFEAMLHSATSTAKPSRLTFEQFSQLGDMLQQAIHQSLGLSLIAMMLFTFTQKYVLQKMSKPAIKKNPLSVRPSK